MLQRNVRVAFSLVHFCSDHLWKPSDSLYGRPGTYGARVDYKKKSAKNLTPQQDMKKVHGTGLIFSRKFELTTTTF